MDAFTDAWLKEMHKPYKEIILSFYMIKES